MARILALTSRLPYPPREGHQLRSWHLLRALAAVHEVTLLSVVRDDDAPAECGPLRDMLHRLELFPLRAQRSRVALGAALLAATLGPRPFVAHKYASGRMRARIAQLAQESDLIHVDMLPLLANVPGATGVPLVLNAHNVEHQLLLQRAASEPRRAQRAFLRMQVAKLARFERSACAAATHVLACSADDAAQLAALCPSAAVSVVPNGVDVERNRPGDTQPAHPAQLIFVGQMGWFPNREGVAWFLAEVLPRILAARPDTRFVLVGKSQGVQVPAALRANVQQAGFVADLSESIRAAAVYVVPLRSGSGTRLKVLEAMAFGKAIVTTRIGAEGIDLADGREALFADTAEQFSAAVLELLDDPRRAWLLGLAARKKAQAHYDWNTIGRELVALYERILDVSAQPRASDTAVLRPARGAPLPS